MIRKKQHLLQHNGLEYSRSRKFLEKPNLKRHASGSNNVASNVVSVARHHEIPYLLTRKSLSNSGTRMTLLTSLILYDTKNTMQCNTIKRDAMHHNDMQYQCMLKVKTMRN